MTTFRVHYESGDFIDVDAEDPIEARQQANQRKSGQVTKVKVLKVKP
ncbi:hypothetical protein [Phyllobacterium sp. YR531]|nr:hypothetical protein [Phyllobacterium sp. YR531]EJN04286.1 hypothetical protein PMI41_01925 [Phyllobacterium sp. YR531]